MIDSGIVRERLLNGTKSSQLFLHFEQVEKSVWNAPCDIANSPACGQSKSLEDGA